MWFSNEFGTKPLKTLLVQQSQELGEDRSRASLRRIFFKKGAAVIPAGERIASDPLKFAVQNLSELVISIYLPDDLSGSNSPISYHVRGLQTNYLAPGKQIESAILKTLPPAHLISSRSAGRKKSR